MHRLEVAGYPVTLHVHDEIVCEASIEFGSIDEFQRLVTTLPEWAEGLPVAAKVRNGPRFAKSEKPTAAVETPVPVSETTPPWTDEVALPTATTDSKLNSAESDSIDDIVIEDMPWIDINAIKVQLRECGNKAPDNVKSFSGNSGAASAGNGRDRKQHASNNDGYPHGEHDTGRRVAFFTYQHADGQPYLGVKKTSTKQFPQYHWNGHRWVKGAPKGPKIPYRLRELIKAPLDALIVIAAGEKHAETAARLGFVATTNSEGERKGAWAPELNAWFVGRNRVAIMEDNDDTGRSHVMEVANALRGIVPDIHIVTFRDLPEHSDLTDWIELGHGRDLLAKIEATKPYHQRPQPLPIRQWDGQPVPELEYAVPDRFPLENVGLFSGEGGQGKSSLVEQLCVAHVLEREWLGCIPRQGAW